MAPPPAQLHVPPLQLSPAGHMFPQVPQFFASVSTDVQAVPQKFGMALGQQVVPLQV
jgi:hypothetical protein